MAAMVVASVGLSVPAVQLAMVRPVSASTASQIASDQSTVQQISAAVAADNSKLNGLDEEYNEAQIRVQQDQQNVDQAESKLQETQGEEASTVAMLRREAVSAYIQGGHVAALAALVDGNASNLAVRSYYVDEASNEAQTTVAELKAQQRQIAQEQAVYSQALSVDKNDLDQVQSDKAAEASVTASENAQLSQVKGNLAALYQQQQEEEQAAAEAAAQAAAEAAQASDPAPLGPAPPVSGQAGIAVEAALAQQGKPYIWGGAGPDGFDCSGLVMYSWDQAGVSLEHGSIAQYYETTRVSESQLEPGDLVFYSPPGDPPLGHVAMYIGNGEVVQALETGVPVEVTSMYLAGTPVGYGRVS